MGCRLVAFDSPHSILQLIDRMRHIMDLARLQIPFTMQGPLQYPEDVRSFIALFPTAYADDAQPVTSKVDAFALQCRIRETGARNTHTSVRSSTRLSHKQGAPHAVSPAIAAGTVADITRYILDQSPLPAGLPSPHAHLQHGVVPKIEPMTPLLSYSQERPAVAPSLSQTFGSPLSPRVPSPLSPGIPPAGALVILLLAAVLRLPIPYVSSPRIDGFPLRFCVGVLVASLRSSQFPIIQSMHVRFASRRNIGLSRHRTCCQMHRVEE